MSSQNPQNTEPKVDDYLNALVKSTDALVDIQEGDTMRRLVLTSNVLSKIKNMPRIVPSQQAVRLSMLSPSARNEESEPQSPESKKRHFSILRKVRRK